MYAQDEPGFHFIACATPSSIVFAVVLSRYRSRSTRMMVMAGIEMKPLVEQTDVDVVESAGEEERRGRTAQCHGRRRRRHGQIGNQIRTSLLFSMFYFRSN